MFITGLVVGVLVGLMIAVGLLMIACAEPEEPEDLRDLLTRAQYLG